MAKVELEPSEGATSNDRSRPLGARRGWPGGADGPGVITSRSDPRFAEVVAAEQKPGLPAGARRGWPGRRG